MLQQNFSVGLSVSASADTIALGFDDRVLNRLTIRLSEFFLFHGARMVFGHDWREDGVMQAVAQLAETAASGGRLSDLGEPQQRLLNVVPTEGKSISQSAQRAQEYSGGVLRALSLLDLVGEDQALPDGWSSDRVCELWVLRRELTRLLAPGARICLGGRTTGYGGYYAGLAEEAFMAMQQHKPLYLLGGFGGVTEVFARVLQHQKVDLAPLLPAKELSDVMRRTADLSDLPLKGLAPAIEEFGIQRLSDDNGLDPEENLALFQMTDIETAMRLIWKGINKLPAK